MTTKHWVLVERSKIEKEVDSVHLFGSLTRLCDHGILVYGTDGKKHALTYDALRNRVSETRYWRNEDYLIKECELLTSKRK